MRADARRNREALLEAAREVFAEQGPGAAGLYEWLGDFVGHVTGKRDLAEALAADEAGGSAEFAAWHDAITAAVTSLLERAGEEIRPDVDPVDLLVMVTGVALTGAGPERTARLIGLLRRGTDRR